MQWRWSARLDEVQTSGFSHCLRKLRQRDSNSIWTRRRSKYTAFQALAVDESGKPRSAEETRIAAILSIGPGRKENSATTLSKDDVLVAASDADRKPVIPPDDAKTSTYYRIFSPPWLSETGFWMARPVSTRSRRVHGTYVLPSGYDFATVPAHLEVASYAAATGDSASDELPTTGSPVSVAVGLYQIVSGAVTLYWARGDQAKLYGYASFSLAVIPYILMTTVNLIAQLFTDDYPVLYMVETDIMQEAMGTARGGMFHGMVGRIDVDDGTQPDYYPFFLPGEDLGSIRITHTTRTAEGVATAQGEWSTPLLDGQRSSVEMMQYLDTGRMMRYSNSANEPSTTLRVPCCSLLRTRPGMLGKPPGSYRHWRPWPGEMNLIIVTLSTMIAPFVLCAVVVLIVYGLSRFEPGSAATTVQRGFIISWIVIGTLQGSAAFAMIETVKAGFVLNSGRDESLGEYRALAYRMFGFMLHRLLVVWLLRECR